MKRLMLCFCLLLVPLFSSAYIYSLSQEETNELREIVQELKELNNEQSEIISRSQKRNSELEALSQTQKQQISELQSLSEDKQRIIDEQTTTIEELKNSSKEPKSFSIKTFVNSLVAVFLSFFTGFFIGKVFF